MTRRTWYDTPAVDSPLAAAFLNDLEARKSETDLFWVNVKDPPFNAAGDGVTDDTAAIQAAINSLPVATTSTVGLPVVNDSGGGTIYFPKGVYNCVSPLNLDGKIGVTLRGDSGAGSFYNGAPPSRLRYTSAGSASFLSMRTTYGVSIMDLGVSHTNTSYTGTLVDLSRVDTTGQGSSGFTATNCYFAGNPPYLTSQALGVNCDLLLNSQFFQCFFEGLAEAVKGLYAVPSSRWSNTVRFFACNFSRMVATAIRNPGAVWGFYGCTWQQLNNGKAGAIVSDANVFAQGLVIDSCYFGDAGTFATGTASTNLIAAAAHGCVAGEQIGFLNPTGGAGITALTTYYVIASGLTANEFKFSATLGGAEFDFTTDLTAATLESGTWIQVETRGFNLSGCWISAGAKSVDLTGAVVGGVSISGNNFHYVPTGVDLGANNTQIDIGGNNWDNVTARVVSSVQSYAASSGVYRVAIPSDLNFWQSATNAWKSDGYLSAGLDISARADGVYTSIGNVGPGGEPGVGLYSDTVLYRDATLGNQVDTDDNFAIMVAGKGLKVKEGTNAKQGVSGAMTSGAVTVTNTAITANSRLLLTRQAGGTNPGAVYESTRTAGTSFVITSTNAADTGTVAYEIFEPA